MINSQYLNQIGQKLQESPQDGYLSSLKDKLMPQNDYLSKLGQSFASESNPNQLGGLVFKKEAAAEDIKAIFPRQVERFGAIEESIKQKSFQPLIESFRSQFEELSKQPLEEMVLNFGLLPMAAIEKKVVGEVGKKTAPKVFQGFKDLTTKFLDYAKGKTTLSRQEIMDFVRRPELKKGEVGDLDVLIKNLPEGKHSAKEIADALRYGSEKYGTRGVLELKPVKVKSPQYEEITLQAREMETIEPGIESEFAELDVPGLKNYEEVVFESPITTNGSSHYPNSKKYFAHARGDEVVESGKKIWREQEIQSDLLQKDNLDRLKTGERARINEMDRRRFAKTPEEHGKELRKLGYNKEYVNNTVKEYTIDRNYVLGVDINKEIDLLSPFTNDRFGERIIRERIKEKAQKGYSKYRLPTGETIGKIEGFERPVWTTVIDKHLIDITPQNIKVGQEVTRGAGYHDNWIITDILGDGRFKAVEKKIVSTEHWVEKNGQRYLVDYTPKEIQDAIARGQYNRSSETFDLTGKSNPQYRRYSDWGKFLKNKYGGKEIIDPQGNKWMEIDLKKEMGKFPIEAFSVIPFLAEDENQ